MLQQQIEYGYLLFFSYIYPLNVHIPSSKLSPLQFKYKEQSITKIHSTICMVPISRVESVAGCRGRAHTQ